MKRFKIVIPQDLEDYRLCHVDAFNTLYENDHSLASQLELISKISGVPKAFVRQLKERTINKMYTHILLSFESYKLGKHKEEITINGIDYCLVNPSKVGTGWWIDYRNLPNKQDHSMICAMMYVEKGLRYAQPDEQENTINPTMERAKVFKEHFPMVEYWNSRIFFLKKLNQLQINSIRGVLIAKKVTKFLNSLRFLKRSKQLTQ